MSHQYPENTSALSDTIDGISDDIDLLECDFLATGEATMHRRYVSNVPGLSNGNMRLSYFTARKSATVTQIRSVTSTQAQVGATLCRIGVYSVDGSGNLTLIASIPNTTSLWLATNTAYTTNLSASFSKVRGTRYAVGVLIVGSSTAPLFMGASSLVSHEAAAAPRLSGFVTGLSDLPASVAAGSILDSGAIPYVVLL